VASTLVPSATAGGRGGVAVAWRGALWSCGAGAVRFAGHNKWSKIKKSKGLADAQKAVIYSKISKEISAAVKAGGPDPAANLRLASALDRAKLNHVTKEVIDGALKRAADSKDAHNLETVFYEGTGPGGSAFMVECLTDKRTRTGPAMRHIFTKFGGELGATGSVSWQFPLSGHLLVDLKREADGSGGVSEDSVLAAALDAGATDVQVDDEEGTADVMCPPNLTHQLKVALASANVPVVSASITRFPSSQVDVSGHEDTVRAMIEAFEDNEDVQHVFHNAE